jgi:hypothetical protein
MLKRIEENERKRLQEEREEIVQRSEHLKSYLINIAKIGRWSLPLVIRGMETGTPAWLMFVLKNFLRLYGCSGCLRSPFCIVRFALLKRRANWFRSVATTTGFVGSPAEPIMGSSSLGWRWP